MTHPVAKVALNPIQWFATADGWIDPSLAPPIRERMAVIAENGFTAVQTELPADGFDLEYAALLADYGIAPGPGYFSASWSKSKAEQSVLIDSARRVAARHAKIGVDLIFFSSGMSKDAIRVQHAAIGEGFDPYRLEQIAGFLDAVGAAMAGEGVAAALHPHVGTWVETEAETRFVLDHSDPANLHFGPDIGHLAWAGADHLKLVADYKARIPGLHIKDFDQTIAATARAERQSYQATVMRGLWREPGYGSCDLDALYSVLGRERLRWAVIEVDRPMAPSVAESIARCGVWANRFFAP